MEEREIIEKIQEKGLTVNCFDELNEVIELMETNLEKMRTLAENSTEKLRSHVEYTDHLPFNSNDIRKYEEQIKDMRGQFESKMYWMINSKYNSIHFESDDYDEFLKTQEKFDARAILYYFFEKYGENEEEIRLAQIQESIINSFESDEIEYSGKKGIKFRIDVSQWNNDRVDNLPQMKQLADVVIGKIKPTDTKGFQVDVYAGSTYHGKNFESMRLCKNKNATITFNNERDCKTFAEAIFADPSKILNSIGV